MCEIETNLGLSNPSVTPRRLATDIQNLATTKPCTTFTLAFIDNLIFYHS